jgi:hypothetical protein
VLPDRCSDQFPGRAHLGRSAMDLGRGRTRPACRINNYQSDAEVKDK